MIFLIPCSTIFLSFIISFYGKILIPFLTLFYHLHCIVSSPETYLIPFSTLFCHLSSSQGNTITIECMDLSYTGAFWCIFNIEHAFGTLLARIEIISSWALLHLLTLVASFDLLPLQRQQIERGNQYDTVYIFFRGMEGEQIVIRSKYVLFYKIKCVFMCVLFSHFTLM